MFKKVQIRLTLFTLIVLICFLAAFSGIAYFQTKNSFVDNTKRGMDRISSRVESLDTLPDTAFAFPGRKDPSHGGNNNDGFLKKPSSEEFFIPRYMESVLWDSNINVTVSNVSDEELVNIISAEAASVFASQISSFSTFDSSLGTYRVLTTYYDGPTETGVVQVVFTKEFEDGLLAMFFRGMFIIWISSILFLGLISWILTRFALKPAKKAWEQQKRFIADISHELRTPITVIKANLEIPISDSEGSIKENMLWLENSYDEAENMSKLVNELIEMSKIDSGQEKLLIEDVHLSYTVSNLVTKMQPLFNKKGVVLLDDIEKDVVILGDKNKIQQLCKILVDNSLKHTEKGSANISLKTTSSSVILQVTDTGVGIAKEDQSKIFDRFYRTDSARYRADGSVGLGLNIAKWIADSHKGSISVESELGKGSIFTVTLPNK